MVPHSACERNNQPFAMAVQEYVNNSVLQIVPYWQCGPQQRSMNIEEKAEDKMKKTIQGFVNTSGNKKFFPAGY